MIAATEMYYPNPFHYGSPAGPDHFCDREAELRAISSRMLNAQNVILLSPRRYGKTSLLMRAIDEVRKRKGRTGYVSLIKCSSRREVAEALVAGVLNGPLSKFARTKEQMMSALGHLRISPSLTWYSEGKVSVSFDSRTGEERWGEILQDALRMLARVSEGHTTSFVMDEFQRIAEIDKGLAGVFKAAADDLRGTSFVFAGSKLHLMREISSGPGAPLLGMGEKISLDTIPEQFMVEYLIARSAIGKKTMSVDAAQHVYKSVRAIPNDVQRLAYATFDVAATAHIGPSDVDEGMRVILSHEATDFAEAYERLAPSQQRVIRLLAQQPTEMVYTKVFMDAAQVANDNAIRTALRVLTERELVHRKGRTWEVSSTFFQEWLREA